MKNIGVPNSDGQSNPAGLLYKLHVLYNTICEQPPVDVCSNIQDNQSSVPEGMTASEGICSQNHSNNGGGGGGGSSTFDYWGCTNRAATNFNSLANKDDNSCKLPGSNGGSGGGSTTIANGGGEVLGASTTTEPNLSLPSACAASPYLHDFLKYGKKNDSEQVKLLQQFLNDKIGANLPVNGYFGKLTRMWVKKLQKAHHQEIIQPWIDAGYNGKDIENGTGYAYKTTLHFINIMKCDTANIPMPDLTPDIN